MPIELDDPELLECLKRAGVHSVHEPMIPFLADGTIDLDRTMAIAINIDAGRGGIHSAPSRHASVIITRIAYGMPPTRYEPYFEDGVLGGVIPFTPEVWGAFRAGRLAVRTYQRFPDTVRDALAGRPLSQLIDLPAFAGRSYVIDGCVVEGAVTVSTCLVDLLSVEEAVERAREARAAATPSKVSDAETA